MQRRQAVSRLTAVKRKVRIPNDPEVKFLSTILLVNNKTRRLLFWEKFSYVYDAIDLVKIEKGLLNIRLQIQIWFD